MSHCKLHVEALVQTIRAFEDGKSWENKDEFCTVLTVVDRGMHECRITAAHGLLDGVTDEIARLCAGLNYRKLFFEVRAGQQDVTRLAKFVETDGEYDRYVVDLTKS